MAVRLYPLCFARRVTAPQAPLTTAAALPIHSSTGKVSIVVSLHDPSDFSLGLIRRLTCYRAAKLSTRFPQKTGVLRRSRFRDVPRSLYRAPYCSDRVVRRWQQQEPWVHPTYNIEVIDVTGNAIGYTVHM